MGIWSSFILDPTEDGDNCGHSVVIVTQLNTYTILFVKSGLFVSSFTFIFEADHEADHDPFLEALLFS